MLNLNEASITHQFSRFLVLLATAKENTFEKMLLRVFAPYMAFVEKTSLRATYLGKKGPIRLYLTILNHIQLPDLSNVFITLFALVVDKRDHRLNCMQTFR